MMATKSGFFHKHVPQMCDADSFHCVSFTMLKTCFRALNRLGLMGEKWSSMLQWSTEYLVQAGGIDLNESKTKTRCNCIKKSYNNLTNNEDLLYIRTRIFTIMSLYES